MKINIRCLGAFCVVTVLAGMVVPAVADQFPVGAEASLSGGHGNGSQPWPGSPAFHALADVNGDGFADLIYTLAAPFGTPQTNVYVQYSNGTRFGAPVVVAADASASAFNCSPDNCEYDAQALINAVGDVNGDGRPDILFADGTVALGNGSGFGPKTAWGAETSLSGGHGNGSQPWPGSPAFHALADVNGDGFADLIYTLAAPFGTPQTNVYVQYSNGTSFGAPVVVAADASASAFNCSPDNCEYDAQALINAVGDVNGDGRPDILFADGTVALGNGSGFGPKTAWGAETSLSGGHGNGFQSWPGSPAFHALADVNGDGFADLIYTLAAPFGTPQTNVYVQYSNGTSFAAPVVVAIDASASAFNCSPDTCQYDAQALVNAVGDVNGDGQKDLLFANGSVTTVLRNVTLYPLYIIGSVIYVPPGPGASTVTYGTGTVTGTTVSTTDTWKSSSTAGASQIGNSVNGGSVTFGFEFGASTTNSVDMQNTTNQNTVYRGSASNSIDHDQDQILIFLGVQMNASADYPGNVTWNVDFSHMLARGFAVDGYSIPVGCLRPSSPMFSSPGCTSQQSFLSSPSIGITSADYPSIMRADPFADPNAPPTPDPARYRRIDAKEFEPNLNISTKNFNETNGTTFTNATTTSYSYSVGGDGHFTIPSWFTTFKQSNTFTWTNSSTTTYKTGNTASSAFSISMPSAPYSGPGMLYIYLDTIYHTFMFSFN